MTRRLGERRPRRPARTRAELARAEHGGVLAAVRPSVDRAPQQGHGAEGTLLRALAEENALLARELGRVQARFTRWREDGIVQADRLDAQLMRTRAEAIVKETLMAVLREGLPRAESRDASARRVLCVGGRVRQVPVYRALVERHGGRLAHVDAVDADCMPALVAALAEADLVILQPGFACRGACLAVAAHCAHHGVRCLQLDKTCALAFAQQLELALADD